MSNLWSDGDVHRSAFKSPEHLLHNVACSNGVHYRNIIKY